MQRYTIQWHLVHLNRRLRSLSFTIEALDSHELKRNVCKPQNSPKFLTVDNATLINQTILALIFLKITGKCTNKQLKYGTKLINTLKLLHLWAVVVHISKKINPKIANTNKICHAGFSFFDRGLSDLRSRGSPRWAGKHFGAQINIARGFCNRRYVISSSGI